MWYWKTNSDKSIRYFETAQAACDDVFKKKRYQGFTIFGPDEGAVRVIHIPNEKNPNYLKIGVRFSNSKLIPDFTLFPQERNPEGSIL